MNTQQPTADMTTNLNALANLAAVPEPSTVALGLAGGGLGLLAAARRRRGRA